VVPYSEHDGDGQRVGVVLAHIGDASSVHGCRERGDDGKESEQSQDRAHASVLLEGEAVGDLRSVATDLVLCGV
jgi:hypothetical protein